MPATRPLTTTQQGRGHEWQQLCRQAKRQLPWICVRCSQPIDRNPDDPELRWSGGHKVALGAGGRRHGLTLDDIQPEHLRCNKQAQTSPASSWRSRVW